MMFRALSTTALLGALAALCSCASSTTPTATQMDRYYEKAEQMAQSQIDIIDGQLRRGEISQESYDDRLKSIKNNIPNQAQDMAWARHEISDAQKRQLGIPTGGNPVDMSLPSAGAAGGFYRPYNQQGGDLNSQNYGTATSGAAMWKGYQPGSMAGSLGGMR
ncbi:hypothetical protein DES53_10987 [Roseimicrobium gellanilyticum]|uniref:Oligomerization/nucleic acid binding protein n=1 Tax=Roseimicrobium gellanilyticum TaxID=748857 RepID=A0A366HCG0_9BACT|nr:hypothetical protein [Roseimicrobium gellanilyticum]RBP39660.1 hypothetical protein DES53_10987 [Roseimicrobium gellanilyticum]